MNFIKNLFKKENNKSNITSFEATELQIAVSKILVRTAKIDDEFHILEEQKILDLLSKYFSLNEADAKNLMEIGVSEEKSATDLYAYTNTIKKSLDLIERKKIIEMMWQIIVTDDNFDPYENNLVWRVAELIGISTRERVQIKKDFLSTLNG
ncbi:MAG: TerB family tellurite resistance protein [Rhizobiales bacterium]|nr:TerB family tellurite resistance protein [Hyphomicrobiales bacterium]MBL6770275.1 TerB family tellurite resistance protein [Hyphomicrobiales bacterium]